MRVRTPAASIQRCANSTSCRSVQKLTSVLQRNLLLAHQLSPPRVLGRDVLRVFGRGEIGRRSANLQHALLDAAVADDHGELFRDSIDNRLRQSGRTEEA